MVVVSVVKVRPVSVDKASMVTTVYALVIRMVDEDIVPWIVVAGGCMNSRLGFGELTTNVTLQTFEGPELYSAVLLATRATV